MLSTVRPALAGVVLFLALQTGLVMPCPAHAGADPPHRQITVTGEAEVRVVPDQVILTLGVESNQKTLRAARQHNEAAVRALLAMIESAGIPRRDVQTDHISLEPRYESQRYEQRTLVGFTLRRNIVITLRDVARFDNLIGDAVGAGVNQVHGIQFRTSELRKHRDQARALAIQAAREKASAMAGGLGMQLGRPSSIVENHSGWSSSYGAWWGGSRYSQMTQNVMQQAPQEGGNSPTGDTIAPGTIAVSARVTVVFDLVDAR